MFILHHQLLADTIYIGRLPLCRVLLTNNRLFPWLVLVPEREGITEIFQLEESERITLINEISTISKIVKDTYWPDKINVAALGNQVEQLHVHIIARFKTDIAWPEPVWGKGQEHYEENKAAEAAEKLRQACRNIAGFNSIANEP